MSRPVEVEVDGEPNTLEVLWRRLDPYTHTGETDGSLERDSRRRATGHVRLPGKEGVVGEMDYLPNPKEVEYYLFFSKRVPFYSDDP